MEEYLLPIIGILSGGVISVLVSRYYYKKSIREKTLSCYVQFVSEILTDIDFDLKQKLEINYNGQKVDKLYQTQFIIANTGNICVSNIIQPLTLQIPDQAELLDVNIVHIEPKERNVSYNTIKNSKNELIKFIFPFLNPGEYFVVRLLTKGLLHSPKKIEKDVLDNNSYFFLGFDEIDLFKFTTSVEDLPPLLISKRLPTYYSNFKSRKRNILKIVAIVSICMAFVFSFILYSLINLVPDLLTMKNEIFDTSFSLLNICIKFGLLFIFLLICVALLIIHSLIDSKSNGKKKFTLPRKLDTYRDVPYLI